MSAVQPGGIDSSGDSNAARLQATPGDTSSSGERSGRLPATPGDVSFQLRIAGSSAQTPEHNCYGLTTSRDRSGDPPGR